uniref:Uncharacterized protein n=1 Tax=Anguilla anguilla TaxID=7936 RepID=A0A0E9QEK2_ANGAN
MKKSVSLVYVSLTALISVWSIK